MKTEYEHNFVEFCNGEIDDLCRWDRADFKTTLDNDEITDRMITVSKNYNHTSKKDKAKIWHKTVNKSDCICIICKKTIDTKKQIYTHAKSNFWGKGDNFYIVHVKCVLQICDLFEETLVDFIKRLVLKFRESTTWWAIKYFFKLSMLAVPLTIFICFWLAIKFNYRIWDGVFR
jgi:hypothetical protein